MRVGVQNPKKCMQSGPVTTATCTGSPLGCLSCAEADPTSCNRCEAGYRLTFTGSVGTCSLCPAGYGRDADRIDRLANTYCSTVCQTGCRVCSSIESQCYACMDGYRFNFAGKYCQACLPNTGRAADTQIQVADTQCTVACSPDCLYCGGTPETCVGCYEGFKLDYALKQCKICDANKVSPNAPYPLVKNGNCGIDCSGEGALFCGTRSQVHFGCKENYMYNYAFKMCIKCPAGFTKAADTGKLLASTTCDIPCYPGCKSCIGTSTNCDLCKAGYFYSASAKTCRVCEAGTGSDAQVETSSSNTQCSGECVDPNCRACNLSGNTCFGCVAGYKYNILLKTCTQCAPGTGKSGDTAVLPLADTTCTACNADCKYCANDGRCLACYDNYRLDYASKTCIPCAQGFTRTADTQIQTTDTYCVSQCLAGCAACDPLNPTLCLRCAAGYRTETIGNVKYCRACTGGQGIAEGSDSDTNTVCHVECKIGCENCSDSHTFCISCTSGYFMKERGVCYKCEDGKGKLRDLYPTFLTPSTTNGSSECNISCDDSCGTCRGTTATECLSCGGGFWFNGINSCTECSPLTKISDVDTMKIAGSTDLCTESCDTSCLKCRGTMGIDCIRCKKGYYTLGKGECLACPVGRGKGDDTTDQLNKLAPVNTVCNFECAVGCKHCDGTENTKCLSCLEGYRKTSAGGCELCVARTGTTTQDGVTADVSTCNLTCSPACESCSKAADADSCLMCSGGHYMISPGKCRICPNNFGKAKDLAPLSATQASSVCNTPCNTGCLVCTGTAGECVKCDMGYFLSGPGNCVPCAAGTGKAASSGAYPSNETQQNCFTCTDNCNQCSDAGPIGCTRCKAGYFLSILRVCTICRVGYGKIADASNAVQSSTNGLNECDKQCAAGCRLCSDTGATNCLMCNAGYYMTATGCQACGAGRGKPADTEIASATSEEDACSSITCSPGCELCGTPSPTTCIRCSAGYFLSEAGVCSRCPAGRGKDADATDPTPNSNGSTACGQSCPTCLICAQNGDCLRCDAANYVRTLKTCSACGAGRGKPADTQNITEEFEEIDICSDCAPGCLQCFGPAANQCLKCDTGFYKTDATTCAMCPAGSGKLADPSSTSATFNPITLCNVPCHASCLTCADSSNTGCVNCPAAHFFVKAGSYGSCDMCANGKTKSADTTVLTETSTEADACTLPCNPSCRSCAPGAPNTCLRCTRNHFWSAAGTCTSCADGRGGVFENDAYSVPHSDGDCIDCSPTCLGCTGSGSESCTRCRSGEYLSSTNTCAVCPTGKGKIADAYEVPVSADNGVTECGITCHENCKNCFGPGPNECTTCKDGFYFSGSGTCTFCPPNTGKFADTFSQRTANNPDLACGLCHEACYSCTGYGADKCLMCSAGYVYRGNGQCSRCESGIGKLRDESIHQQYTGPTCPITCDKRCEFCSGPGPNECLSCSGGFWWAGNGVCTQCNSGRGKPQDLETLNPTNSDACTEECDPACLICDGADTPNSCAKCKAGFYLSARFQCSICPTGTGKADDVDFPQVASGTDSCKITCHPSCGACKDATAQGCLNCNGGYFMDQLGRCSLCPLGFGSEPGRELVKTPQIRDEVCQSCHPSCSNCFGPGNTECLGCNAGYYLSNKNTCSQCPDGFGRAADLDVGVLRVANSDGSVECTACHPSCKMCKGPAATDCLNCNDGYFWAGAGSCSACPSGFGKGHDGTQVKDPNTPETGDGACTVPCHESCQNCITNSANSCLSCNALYYKSADGVCESCPFGRGKLADAGVKSLTTTETAGCNIVCSVACAKCTGPSNTQCAACSYGYYLSADGTCSKCPVGWGKDWDRSPPSVTPGDGSDVCTTQCHRTCSSCGDSSRFSCVGCAQRFFYDEGCVACPAGTSKPAPDATGFLVSQTEADCTLKCHPSCRHCSGPEANQCLSCNAGYWRSGDNECTSCPNGKGKAMDELFSTTVVTEESCNIFCDSCSSGCQTCSGNPFECVTCVSDRFLSDDKTCGACPDYCISCTGKDKCDKCAKNFKPTEDGKGCMGDCTVENCAICAEDPSKCTKCNDEFVLKSASECIKDVGVVINELSSVSVLDSPQLNMDIRSDKLELAFSPNESRNFTSVTLQDKLNGKVYTCAEVSCSYSIKNDKLSMDFNPDFTIVQGKLTIERGAAKTTSVTPAWISSHKNRRKMQAQADYPIIVDGISLMKKSPLNSLSFSLRVIVGILRLPLSLVVFWKYPYLAMVMDHMVTHLKLYSLLGHPYMAYVEVVFQSVSDSKVLPFNFDNPFEKWDSTTLDCAGYPGIRNKNLHCSWLDNYGQNFIGLISIGLLILILYYGSLRLAKPDQSGTWLQRVYHSLSTEYGVKFMAAKLDGNHVEIVLMTVIAYCTADGSSKSVIGIILSTLALAAFATLSLFVTWESQRIYRTKLALATAANKTQSELDPEIRLRVVRENNSRSENPNHQGLEKFQVIVSKFVISISDLPENKWSVYFFAARYIRALLLVIFVTTVRDSVEQVVLIVLLESVYLVALILFDTRGTKAERLFYTIMHGLMLLHLILRAAATSESLSEKAVQSNLATGIVVLLLIYIFVHAIVCLLVFAGIFFKSKEVPAASPANPAPNKVEFTEGEGFLPLPKESNQPSYPRDHPASLQSNNPISYYNVDVPEEIQNNNEQPFGEVPPESRQQISKVDNVQVRMNFPQQTEQGTQAAAHSQ